MYHEYSKLNTKQCLHKTLVYVLYHSKLQLKLIKN